ncbi:glycosyltransferase family 4 protein [Mucilaginibacter sp. SP1R1]|uniref:glycosyltransferase family 4 protein n=1 Tax=Mucilaginibacter sp. SP1R1 TaxID=2723091 RepID=UPI0016111EFD|nr:glycosyltransferase family 1 protein [Mucilaginibacter sp. SP1R1]MBB6149562.1 glycosyltransferase involved in cell wall biosynthesis [Mucilaginibacter sp. SP1R1]
MTKVAFILNFTKEYKGGINYIKNLLYACSLEKQSNLEFFLFVPSDIEQEYIDTFSPYAQIIRTSILKRKTLPWFFEKVLERKFSINFLLLRLLKKHKIDVVSHSNFFDRYKSLKIINWVPDFQILHYPDLWNDSERERILKLYRNIVKYSDRIILSSNDAFKDYKGFTSEKIEKVRVMQFVSQPVSISKTELDVVKETVKNKYNIDRDFFYLPNQFWSHKNHITAFKAVNLLKKQGLNPLLITTGHMADYREGSEHIKLIHDYINDNDLADNILLLGLIPYNEVLILISTCLALINPSLFEGWSSTVEEAKSSGKQIILSDIPIHKEQNPATGLYFNPLNEQELAGILKNVLENPPKPQDISLVKENLEARTKLFAEKYHSIIAELF